METDLINAIKELGAVAWLGILSWQAIKLRKNGKNGNIDRLERKVDDVQRKVDDSHEKIYALAQCVARIAGHLNIKQE